MNNLEENGIYGYKNSKSKKIKDQLTGYEMVENDTPLSGEQRAAMLADARNASAEIGYERALLEAPVNKEKRQDHYREKTREFLVPSPNDDLRRRRLFTLSPNVVDDATEGFYNNNVKELFQRERTAAEERARSAYKGYASVPGANEMTALGALRRESDPARVVENTMQKLDSDELDRIANMYASYARLSPAVYRKEVLEPGIRKRLYAEYIKEAKPAGSVEYIARSAYDGSLTGKLMDINMNAQSRTNSQSLIDREGLAAYDANRFEKFAAGLGSLVIDMPMFAGIGSASSSALKGVMGVAKKFTSSLINKMAAKGVDVAVASRIMEEAVKSKMAARILGNSTSQAMTLGGYEAGNSLADDLLLNEGVDVDKIVNAYGHGFANGAAVGMVGTPLRILSRGLTGGKKMAASASVLGAEAGVFTASSLLEKAEAGVDVEPIDLLYDYAESVATLGAMKLAHWRPKGGYAKLMANGKLKKELNFTPSEQQEMQSAGVNPSAFVGQLESVLAPGSRGKGNEASDVKTKYLQMMSSDKLSASTRSKLLYLVENKITSTPPMPVDYKVEQGDGGYKISMLDANGRHIQSYRDLSHADAETMLIKAQPVLRRNKIAVYENELLGEYDSDNFYRQAGVYAREKGVNPQKIIDAMYKKINNEPLSSAENKILDNISQRAGYGDSRVGYLLQNARRDIEKKYNLAEGSLLDAVERGPYAISFKENSALDEYLGFIQTEVVKLKQGASKEKLLDLDNQMSAVSHGDVSNYDVKFNERRNYLEKNGVSKPETGDRMYTPITVPEQWNKPYAWSVYNVKNSPSDLNMFEARATELAKKLGYDVKFIRDERSIPLSENSVAEYNNKVRSLGWLDASDGSVYINLPNISNMHELEKTFVHEMIGHGGLSKLFGEYLYEFYDDIYKRADPSLRKALHNAGRQYGLEGYSAIEEYLATLVEGNSLTPKEESVLNRFKSFFKNMLVKKNLYSPGNNNITTKDLKDFLGAHQQAMLSKKRPNEYRASLLGKFPAMKNIPDFYDHAGYEKYMLDKYPDKQRALSETPGFLWNEKKILLDDIDYGERAKRPSSYRFIGKRGAQNLMNSEYRDEIKSSDPEKAKMLERNFYTPERIWKMTGWERGADGRWRTEISEDKLKVRDITGIVLDQRDKNVAAVYRIISQIPSDERTPKQTMFMENIYNQSERIFNNVDLKLRHVIQDPVLFTAYPELTDVPVFINNKMNDVPCEYDVSQNKLYLNSRTITEPNVMKEEIVGALQKMIQKVEGFSISVDLIRAEAKGNLKKRYDTALQYSKMISKLNKPELNDLYKSVSKMFERKYGIHPDDFETFYPTSNEYVLKIMYDTPMAFSPDVEARNAYMRQFYDKKVRETTPPSETEDVPRESQVPFVNFAEVEHVLSGPLDIIKSFYVREMSALRGYDDWRKQENELNLPDDIFDAALVEPNLHEFFEKHKKGYKKPVADDYYTWLMENETGNDDNADVNSIDKYLRDNYIYDKNGNLLPYPKQMWHDENNKDDILKESYKELYRRPDYEDYMEKLGEDLEAETDDNANGDFEIEYYLNKDGKLVSRVKLKEKTTKKGKKSFMQQMLEEASNEDFEQDEENKHNDDEIDPYSLN